MVLRPLVQSDPLTAIGLLGHRSLGSTSQYLRLHTDDLRAAALDLPVATGSAVYFVAGQYRQDRFQYDGSLYSRNCFQLLVLASERLVKRGLA